jgi:two-component system sensor histidine kinase RegB
MAASLAPALTPGLLRNLALLRWFAVAGQLITVALVLHVLQIPLQPLPLWCGIAALALFNLWASWRVRRLRRVEPIEVVAHLSVDIAVLAWLIGWSGGAMNPFAPLFLLPIALAAVALPARWVLASAVLCCIGYAASALLGQPLPHVHGASGDAFNLHLAGMAVMFAISVAVITFFLSRFAQALREREQELAGLREQFARNEGILALATHAAAVAHELNTPLGTLTLMLEDQLEQASASERAELATMAALVDVCRDRVRELAAPAAQAVAVADLDAAIERVVERWQLLRPSILLERSGCLTDVPLRAFDPGIGHLLTALLDNAADASEQAGDARVALHLEADGEHLIGSVRDHGAGFADDGTSWPGALFRSTKPHGLGVGLALSHATVERLGGELALQAADGGGARIAFRLPLRAGEPS